MLASHGCRKSHVSQSMSVDNLKLKLLEYLPLARARYLPGSGWEWESAAAAREAAEGEGPMAQQLSSLVSLKEQGLSHHQLRIRELPSNGFTPAK